MDSQNFTSFAPQPPNGIYFNSRSGELTALPQNIRTSQVLSRISKDPVAAKNLYVPMTFSIEAGSLTGRVVPLTLYITPKDFVRSLQKLVTTNYLRRGPEPEFWGDELDKLTFSGTIAAFYTRANGITQHRQGNSKGYANFLSLLSFYKNNGREYWTQGQNVERDDTAARLNRSPNDANRLAAFQQALTGGRVSSNARVNKGDPESGKLVFDRAGLIKTVGSVVISYDRYQIYGHFDSMSWSMSVNSPFLIEYSASFTVTRMRDSIAMETGKGLGEF